MNNKGFTLIELLAVIVILAIIALIATPIVLGIINNAREESDKRSVELYASSIQNAAARYQLANKKVVHGNFTTADGKTLVLEEDDKIKLNVEYNGKVMCDVIELYSDGTIYLENCKIDDGKNAYNYGKNKVDKVIKLCTANTTKATALIWQGKSDPMNENSYAREEVGLLASIDGAYTTGVAYTCNFIDDNEANNMVFFVLSSTEKYVTLISGSNLSRGVMWSQDGNHKNEPEEKQGVIAKAELAKIIQNGNKLTDRQKETIKLPTKSQIEEAYSGTMPKWLYGYTKSPVAYGYWTSSPYMSDSNSAWKVEFRGGLIYGPVNQGINGYDIGVRPVITISKASIN